MCDPGKRRVGRIEQKGKKAMVMESTSLNIPSEKLRRARDVRTARGQWCYRKGWRISRGWPDTGI